MVNTFTKKEGALNSHPDIELELFQVLTQYKICLCAALLLDVICIHCSVVIFQGRKEERGFNEGWFVSA